MLLVSNILVKRILWRLKPIIYRLLIKKLLPRKKQTLLIVKLDAIGDYILFSSNIKKIRSSEKFKNYSIILLGNVVWSQLAEKWEEAYVDKFIWIDIKKFTNYKYFDYKLKILIKVYLLRCEALINPTLSRNSLTDEITKYSGIVNTIGSETDNFLLNVEQEKHYNLFYSTLIKKTNKILFEQEWYNYFFSSLLKQNIEEHKLDKNTSFNLRSKVLIFPGAGAAFRQWSPNNFAILIEYILSNYTCDIVILGSSNDSKIAKSIYEKITHPERVVDLTGKTSLIELSEIISSGLILVSNETSAVHIAAKTNTPCICISNGNHFGRFNPYPQNIAPHIYTVYPKVIESEYLSLDEMKEAFKYYSEIDINLIAPNSLFDTFSNFLEEIERKEFSKNKPNYTFV